MFKHLDFHNTNLQDTRDVVAALTTATEPIISLDLSSNRIDCIGIQPLTDVLTTLTTLRRLNLSNNNIGDDGLFTRVGLMLLYNKTLTHLDISNNNIGDWGIGMFTAALKGVNTTLTHLVIADKFEEIGTRMICEMLKVNTSLLSLTLNYSNNFGWLIADALLVNKTLQSIVLQHDNMTSKDISFIAKALEINTSITHLDVSHNKKIGDKGAIALATMLKVNKTLKSICVYNCGIGKCGLDAFANALKVNFTLQTLDYQMPGMIEQYLARNIAKSVPVN